MRVDDIVRQRFTKVFRGYDVQEVDLFLDDVIAHIERMEEERNALLARLDSLMNELEHCDRLIEEYQAQEETDAPRAQQKEEAGLDEETPQEQGIE